MSEYQITYWREVPSLVVARAGSEPGADVTKAPLAPRFQEAIDEAAMRLGEAGSDAYLEGWRRSTWQLDEGAPVETADRIVAELEAAWSPDALTAYLDSLGPARPADDVAEEAIP